MPVTRLQIGPIKVCTKCKEEKPIEDFSLTSRTKCGLSSQCKSCVVKHSADWAKKNPDKVSHRKRRARYGIEFNRLWEAQDGNCLVCNEPMLPFGRELKSAVVDHDHSCCSGKTSCGKCVRGLIHWGCNIILGHIENQDRAKIVPLAVAYLAAPGNVIPISAATSKSNKSRSLFYKIDFNKMWDLQSGLCAVCKELMLPKGKESRSVVVDHDKACCPGKGSCGKCVRGLVHSRCNVVIGTLESPEYMKVYSLCKTYMEKAPP